MKDTRLLPDDPKLTAYALGELAGDERAAVEAALRQNPALREIVEEIRVAAACLEAALANEPLEAPTIRPFDQKSMSAVNGHTHGIDGTAKPPRRRRRHIVVDSYPVPRQRAKLLSFPQFYYVLGGFAAACFAVVLALYPRKPVPARALAKTSTQQIALAPTATPPDDRSAGVPRTTPSSTDIRVAAVPSTTPAAVPVAPASTGSQDSAASGTIPAPLPSVSTERALTLMEKAPSDKDRIAVASASAPQVAANAAGRVATETSANGVVDAAISTAASAVTSSGSRHAAFEQITFSATPPPVPESLVAVSGVRSFMPASTSLLSSSSTMTSAGSGEIVMLSAFLVTADRANGFAFFGSSQTETRRRVATDRENLPRPPPGAKFGRNVDTTAPVRDNAFVNVAHTPLSTFSIDVDTASYANVRRMILQGWTPPREMVRIEEMLNYFPYHYSTPKEDVIAASLEIAEAPWAPGHRLLRIGLKAREVSTAERPPANLVFLLDVSSSMNQPNKLPLVKQSMWRLVSKLRPDDRVAIVTYAGNSGLALASTPAAQSREILNALEALTPIGLANGAAGIELAYDVARANFMPAGINRVILCTDGDFDVGTSSKSELLRLVSDKAGSGVFLSVLGFGVGNYRDGTLEKLASVGNGSYGYIDTRYEAEKLLVQQVNGTLVTMAKDVKIQVDFNPALVASYRLIGYENRLLRKEDFSDDSVDAGELGAGQTVTALYEIVPVMSEAGRKSDAAAMLASRYAPKPTVSSRLQMPGNEPGRNELLNVTVRFKTPGGWLSWMPKHLEFPLVDTGARFSQASADFRFAAAIAQFGMLLRGSPHRGNATMGDVIAWAANAATKPADDPGGFRGEFIDLARKAQTMTE